MGYFDKVMICLPEKTVRFDALAWIPHPVFEGVSLKHQVRGEASADTPHKIRAGKETLFPFAQYFPEVVDEMALVIKAGSERHIRQGSGSGEHFLGFEDAVLYLETVRGKARVFPELTDKMVLSGTSSFCHFLNTGPAFRAGFHAGVQHAELVVSRRFSCRQIKSKS